MGHTHTNVSSDIRGVAHGIALPADYDVIALYRKGEADGSSQMIGVIKEYGIQIQKVADQVEVQDGTVFTIAGFIEEIFFPEVIFFPSELLLVREVLEGFLHEVEQHVSGLYRTFTFDSALQCGVKLSDEPGIQWLRGIIAPIVDLWDLVIVFH